MQKDKIMISVPVERKAYYNDDVIKSCMEDGSLAYKNGQTFIRVNIFEWPKFMKELQDLIKKDTEQHKRDKK